ncbi:hypothetical protein ACFWY6_05320 [Streptomyces sp. NPDC059037]|uniref:hypothetical protein n=1 Tax=Streptomyces sp. NPDC059037 TaxID=3346710 RepID=UPI0036BB0F88
MLAVQSPAAGAAIRELTGAAKDRTATAGELRAPPPRNSCPSPALATTVAKAEHYPRVSTADDATSARPLADHRLPALHVVDSDGRPYATVPGSELVGLLVPDDIQEEPAGGRIRLIGAITAARLAEQFIGES